MSQYDSLPISQLPLATDVTALDVFPMTDVNDLTESPSGTTVKCPASLLQGYISALTGSNIISARVGTTGNLVSTYANGTAGVGATLTGTTFGALIIDGITLNVGDRVLVSAQTTTFQNGVYSVTATGDVASYWILTRVPDFNGSVAGQIAQGDFIAVIFGNTNALTWWFLTSASNPVVGTNPIIFTEQMGSSLPYNGFQIYVSKQIGSDITGTGSIANPLASINAAITLGGSPSPTAPITIIIMDGETYDEQIVWNVENLHLYGPQAQLNYSGIGDAITTNSGAKPLMTMLTMACSGGGNLITNNTGGQTFFTGGILAAGNIVNVGTGSIILDAIAIQGNITNGGGGQVFYSTILALGSNDPTVNGISAIGSNSNWNVGTSLTFSDTVNGIVGTNSGDEANGGIVGEINTINVPFASAVTMTTATPINITTVTLTPGDWDVHGNIYVNSSVSMTQALGWLNLTSASAPDQSQRAASTNAGMTTFGAPAPIMRVNVTSNTPVYLSAQATFASGATTACGNIYARRVR